MGIRTALDRFHTADWRHDRTTAFASYTIRCFSRCQSLRMAPKENLSGPGAFRMDCANRAHSTAYSVTDWCACATGGNSKYWLCSFGGKDSHLGISSFLVRVFACFPSLSVRASKRAAARGLANFITLPTLASLWFFRYSFHILSFALRIDFCNFALAWAVAADVRLFLCSLPSWPLCSLISPFRHHFD